MNRPKGVRAFIILDDDKPTQGVPAMEIALSELRNVPHHLLQHTPEMRAALANVCQNADADYDFFGNSGEDEPLFMDFESMPELQPFMSTEEFMVRVKTPEGVSINLRLGYVDKGNVRPPAEPPIIIDDAFMANMSPSTRWRPQCRARANTAELAQWRAELQNLRQRPLPEVQRPCNLDHFRIVSDMKAVK